MCEPLSAGSCGGGGLRKVSDTLELELTGNCKLPDMIWVFGTELGYPVRAVHILNQPPLFVCDKILLCFSNSSNPPASTIFISESTGVYHCAQLCTILQSHPLRAYPRQLLTPTLRLLCLVDQAGLVITEITWLCLLSAGFKDMCHYI